MSVEKRELIRTTIEAMVADITNRTTVPAKDAAEALVLAALRARGAKVQRVELTDLDVATGTYHGAMVVLETPVPFIRIDLTLTNDEEST